MEITMDIIQTLSVAVVFLLIGQFICKHVELLRKFCIPAPVIGGLIFSVLALIGYQTGLFTFKMDMVLKDFFMMCFFTTIGFTASLKLLKKGGFAVILFLILASILVVLQNILGVSLAKIFSLHPYIGLSTASVPMTGGHATSAAFSKLFEEYGIKGSSTVAFASATFGLVMGSLIGGPIAKVLIEKKNLIDKSKNNSLEIVEENNEKTILNNEHVISAFYQIAIALGVGSIISYLLKFTGMAFPAYLGSMFAAAIMRNICDYNQEKFDLRIEEIGVLGELSLSIFLSMALMSLKLWELADLAIPMIVMLLAQTVLMALFVYLITFNIMGRDYDAAVMTAGHCGFGMGATPNAMANMNAIVRKYLPSPKAFFVLPLVGSLFIDFINSTIIFTFMNIFK